MIFRRSERLIVAQSQSLSRSLLQGDTDAQNCSKNLGGSCTLEYPAHSSRGARRGKVQRPRRRKGQEGKQMTKRGNGGESDSLCTFAGFSSDMAGAFPRVNEPRADRRVDRARSSQIREEKRAKEGERGRERGGGGREGKSLSRGY